MKYLKEMIILILIVLISYQAGVNDGEYDYGKTYQLTKCLPENENITAFNFTWYDINFPFEGCTCSGISFSKGNNECWGCM